MNTDRELLELAAKAAGLNVKAERVDADDKFTHLIVGAKNTRERIAWNPLTDDGDALRLAVKLEIELWFGNGGLNASGMSMDIEEDYGEDPAAATRRAIVRAAAAIGEAMK